MGSTVDRKSTALDECFVARFVVTGVGTLVGMNSIMALEVRLSIEALWWEALFSSEPCLERTGDGTRGDWRGVSVPWSILHAIRTGRDEQPCRRQKHHL